MATRDPANGAAGCLNAGGMLAAQEVMAKERKGAAGPPMAKLNNVLMQMRKNCNHPDLISGAYDGSLTYPSADELVAQVGAGSMVSAQQRWHGMSRGRSLSLCFFKHLRPPVSRGSLIDPR